jgi:hypothetical protein
MVTPNSEASVKSKAASRPGSGRCSKKTSLGGAVQGPPVVDAALQGPQLPPAPKESPWRVRSCSRRVVASRTLGPFKKTGRVGLRS